MVGSVLSKKRKINLFIKDRLNLPKMKSIRKQISVDARIMKKPVILFVLKII